MEAMLLCILASLGLALADVSIASVNKPLATPSVPPPPPFTEKARMARYLAHYSDWGIVSALSPEYDGRPFGTLQSFSDGPLGNSSGIPYFYVSVMSDTYKNVQYCNNVTLTLSEATGDYCKQQDWDPEEPVCSRVTLVGQMQPVPKQDQAFAKNALFSRHPAMAKWPTGHDWRFYWLTIEVIHLLDFYGGATHVPVKDYFAAQP